MPRPPSYNTLPSSPCVQHQADAQTSWPQYSHKQFLCEQHQVFLKPENTLNPSSGQPKEQRAASLAGGGVAFSRSRMGDEMHCLTVLHRTSFDGINETDANGRTALHYAA